MSTKHTPGPWIVYKQADSTGFIVATEAVDVHGRRKETIARVASHSYDGDEANARLIAAAPEMLEALKVALEHILKTSTSTEFAPREMIKAAIAKAQGVKS